MSDAKLERQKVTERERFDEEDKLKILYKTGGKCAHCGVEIYIGSPKGIAADRLFTVDHFVPLSRGGFNRMLNLVPLCKPCNDDKDNTVRNPDEYLKYLKPEHLKEIRGLYDSYLNSFEYVNRNNLLANDVYEYELPQNLNPVYLKGMMQKRKGKKRSTDFLRQHVFTYEVRRAFYYDLDDILDYYIRYLKKHGYLESEVQAKKNIIYWFTYGSIYYIRRKSGEIYAFSVQMCERVAWRDTDDNENEDDAELDPSEIHDIIRVMPFFYYDNTFRSFLIVTDMVRQLSLQIAIEQDLPFIPVELMTVKGDTILMWKGGSIEMEECPYDTRFNSSIGRYTNPKYKDIIKIIDETTNEHGYSDEADAYIEEQGFDKKVEEFFAKMYNAQADIENYLGDSIRHFSPN